MVSNITSVRGHELLSALNSAAASLQQSAYSEEEVFSVVQEQLIGLDLSGGISLIDAAGEQLVFTLIVQKSLTQRILERIEKQTGLKLKGFSTPITQVDIYQKVIENSKAYFISDRTIIVEQLVPRPIRQISRKFWDAFEPIPAIYAPLIVEDRVIGILNIVGRGLTPEDTETMAAFANHIAIALNNARLFSSLRESEERFRSVIETANDAIITSNNQGIIVSWNTEAEKMFGRTKENLQQSPIMSLIPEGYRERHKRGIQGAASSGEKTIIGNTVEMAGLRSDGSEFPIELSLSMWNSSGDTFFTSFIRDISERKLTEEHLQYLATHDPLTQLPNRLLFLDRLNQSIAVAKRGKGQHAILFLDLDNFKLVNDAFGHSVGDQLLQIIAERISGTLRESDTVARMGGDEFWVLIKNIEDSDDIAAIAMKILAAISKPLILKKHEIFINSSLGISIFPKDGDNHEVLLQKADAALNKAKSEGKNNFKYFSQDIETSTLEKISLGSQLHYALEKDEFILHYQPKVDIITGKVQGVEALLRWQHPEQGLLPPNRFIQIAEDTGQMVPIGEWVLRTACDQISKWHKDGLTDLRLAVNLSERQIRQGDLVEMVCKILKEKKLDPAALELELSESIVFQESWEAFPILMELKELGVQISIDDFGTGYSTLHQLTYFPFDVLKIDQSFVPEITKNPKVVAIISGILDIANNLDLDVVAEGIETGEQLEIYRKEGCTLVQGYYFSRPVPAQEIPELIKQGISNQ